MPTTIYTSAEAFQQRIPGQLLNEHRGQSDTDVFVQILARHPAQDPVVIPAVPEPLLVWILSGEAVVEERTGTGPWLANRVAAGDFFLTTATTPTEMRWLATGPQPFQVMHVYIGVQLLKQALRDVLGRVVAGFTLREVSGQRDELLSALLAQIRVELGRATASRVYVQGLAQALTVHLVRTYETTAAAPAQARGGLPAYKLHRVFDAMQSGLAEPFELGRLARLAELSVFHFSRAFKQSTGVSPSSYFIGLRVERAKQLLRDGEQAIISVCLAVGYASPSHFAAIFRGATGVTPSDYRDSHASRPTRAGRR